MSPSSGPKSSAMAKDGVARALIAAAPPYPPTAATTRTTTFARVPNFMPGIELLRATPPPPGPSGCVTPDGDRRRPGQNGALRCAVEGLPWGFAPSGECALPRPGRDGAAVM